MELNIQKLYMEKMQDPLISVIVPVYNVGNYLARCIESIIGQTYKKLEIILVDDGSTDNSSEICDRYKKSDERIKVIHKCNGGLSSARNAGIEIAAGEYLAFVDSDDWILSHHIESLYSLLSEANVLMAICQSQKVYSEADANSIANISGHKLLAKEKVMYAALTQYKWWSACDKLFHRSLFDTIRFPVERINEDYAIIFYLFDKCDRIAVSNQITYCYYMRQGSITTSGFNVDKFAEYVNAIEVLDFLRSKYPSLAAPAENILISTCLKLLSNIANVTDDKYAEWRQKLLQTVRGSFCSWILNPHLMLKQKILLMPACVSFGLFKMTNKIYAILC